MAGTDGSIFTREALVTMQRCISTFENKINNTPTAFDTEKVVEKLESLSNAEADYYYARSNDVIDREDAIDIVKKGGAE